MYNNANNVTSESRTLNNDVVAGTAGNSPKSCTPIIEFNDVCFAYDTVPVLRHISFTINGGECILLSGDNGAGKSTIFKIINGLYFPEIGEYRYNGTAITKKNMKDNAFSKRLHQSIGFLWQNPDIQLFCNSLREDIAFGPQQLGLPLDEVRKRTNDALQLLGIQHLADRPPYRLSGGEKKRGAIATLLTINPDVWVMDEPFTALDKKGREWLLGFLMALKKAGKTIIISSHEVDELEELIDRVIHI